MNMSITYNLTYIYMILLFIIFIVEFIILKNKLNLRNSSNS